MSNNVKALKSGVWYTFASFLTKGIGFLTTPIFTRLLSKTDYGLFSNYSSWLSTFTIFMTLGLGTTFISAKFDYKEHFEKYVSSVLVLSSIVTLLWAAIVFIFNSVFVTFTGVESKYLYVMILYLMMYSAVDMYQAKERYLFGYKQSVLVSVLIAVSTAGLSVVLVNVLEDRLAGRILGSALPTIIIGIILYFLIIKRGKCVDIAHWKYALPICLPYIPHILSLTLLNSMDKVMITRICGASDNALYSVAYSCGAIITMLSSSISVAFSPWLGEKLNEKQHSEIYNISIKYISIFAIATCGVMLITPELLLLMGGREYVDAIYVMPPVTFGCLCQFIYSMYVSVEQYKKKTVGMAIASGIAALSNYILNYIYIPRYGYIAGAYTTLASYMILLFIHIWLVKRMKLSNIYPLKVIFATLIAMTAYTILINFVYGYTLVRYILVTCYSVFIVIGLYRYRALVAVLFRRGKKIL